MPYTTNPTFSDGAILSAAALNTICDNIEYLHSLVSGVQAAFTSDVITGSTGELKTSRNYAVRYQARYLIVKARITSGESDVVQFLIDEVAEYTDSTNRTAPYTWEFSVDLTGITTPPTLLDFLSCRFTCDFDTGGNVVLDYIYQSDVSSL